MKKIKIKRTGDGDKKKYLIDYKAELNPQQFKAATSKDGPHLVIAGAGSGKTRTLIFRLAYLVENGIAPQSILLLTFTRKASQEMMRRAANILDERCRNVSGGTFHSFANYILRKYSLYIGWVPNFTIVDRADAEGIINLIRTELALNKKDRRFPKKSTILNVISKATNKCQPIDKIVLDEYPNFKKEIKDIERIARLYQEFKKQKQVMDYDDLLVYLRQLLETNDEVRQKISNTYKYIMVDEYQDTNLLQADIAALLASEHHNVLVVGDDSQSIYSFRGANFRNIMDFPKTFPGAEVITLEQNYRSTRPILDLTNAIIQQAQEKYSKELFSKIEGIEKPLFIDGITEKEQADFISHQVLELREEGVPLHKIAVLFRAAWHSNELEIALKRANIPYVKYGGLKFAEAAHVKDALSYLRVLHNPMDGIAWIRLLELMEGIGPSTASKITEKITTGGGSLQELQAPEFATRKFGLYLRRLYNVLSRLHDPDNNLTPTAQLEAVIKFYTPLFEAKFDDFHRRREDLNSLLHISERYSTIDQMLTDMALEPPTRFQDGVEPTDNEDEKLILSTIHSAKGLEWHSVFVIHLVDGFFPDSRTEEKEEELEEERRLFYVAATRAQKNLYMLSPKLEARSWSTWNPSGMIFSQPSRFIEEIPDFEELTETAVIEFEEEGEPF